MKRLVWFLVLIAVNAVIYGVCFGTPGSGPQYVVVAYNDLGMHCTGQDFSEICILPPANTLRAQVIDRSQEDPRIVTSGITLRYNIPGNTESASKTNFWDYTSKLFGVNLAKNVGLAGNGLSGLMVPTPDRDFMAKWIPATEITDARVDDPYQYAQVKVSKNGVTVANTRTTIPVSWEMSCNRCHNTPGISTNTDILRKHDKREGTTLEKQKPVLCAACHADNAIGAAGVAGVKNLSAAMHTFHSKRMGAFTGMNGCYSCHPGPKTQCLRDVHRSKGMGCNSCHSTMLVVGSSKRKPWIDEPKCGSCHHVAGHEYEQPGVLYRDSVGHNGVKCVTCHGSPHSLGPSRNVRDNIQPVMLQGKAGTLTKCTICHQTTPSEAFNHTRGD